MDTYRAKQLMEIGAEDAMPRLRSLDVLIGNETKGHVFWPVHHPNVGHWSLIHIDIAQKTVTAHDSCWDFRRARTILAMKVIFDYWMKTQVKQEQEKNEWQQLVSRWASSFFHFQADGSNDGGAWTMLLMRLLQARELPDLPRNPFERESLTLQVGERMRRRMAAEIIGGWSNPLDEDIPSWLKE